MNSTTIEFRSGNTRHYEDATIKWDGQWVIIMRGDQYGSDVESFPADLVSEVSQQIRVEHENG